MKKYMMSVLVMLVSLAHYSYAQEIETMFKTKHSGGFGALTNSFSTIGGKYANLAGFYGGWYVDSKLLLGIETKFLTNDLPVLPANSTNPTANMSYAYGQFGFVTEYIMASNKKFHAGLHLFTGAGFTGQYQRFNWDSNSSSQDFDEDFFTVVEPGVLVEINLFKWMRFSPGVSYRAVFGSNTSGLTDHNLSNISYNLGLKFGKF